MPLFVLLFCSSANSAFAQSISLSGSSNVTVGDADEYFTDEWGLPKNFDRSCDIGNDIFNFSSKGVSNGIWSGYHPQMPAPKIGIMPVPTTGTLFVYREDCGKLGYHVPLNADKYTYLSYKSNLATSDYLAILWTHDTNYAIRGYDRPAWFNAAGGHVYYPANQWVLTTDYIPPLASSLQPWSGNITGLTIWPSLYLPAATTMQFDWVRIFDPNTSPNFPLSWTSSGGGGSGFVSIYADSDNSGYDGFGVSRGLTTNSSANILTGVLAPGTYYFYAQLESRSGVSSTVLAQSNYIGPVRVNGKSTLQFTSPSRTSGQEYSRDELGNPWDMNGIDDTSNLVDGNGALTPVSFRGIENWQFSGGVMTANTVNDPVGGTIDSHIHLHIAPNKPINTNFYRYFCYRMQVDPSHLSRSGDGPTNYAAGWVARFMWIKNGVVNSLGSSVDHELVERSASYPDYANGMVTYCMDLWDAATRQTGPDWRDSKFASSVRFDPLEAMPATQFALDWAGLYAENQTAANHIFPLSWTLENKEADSISVSLYRDSDQSGFDGTLITTLTGQSAGSGSYSWDTSGVPSGTYYVYAVVNDGYNTSKYYSDVPIQVVSTPSVAPPARRTYCDYNGDGKSDHVYIKGSTAKKVAKKKTKKKKKKKKSKKRSKKKSSAKFLEPIAVTTAAPVTVSAATAGTWYVRYSNTSTFDTVTWGNPRVDLFGDMDLDGDRIADETLIRARTDANYKWYGLDSFDFNAPITWFGIHGDIPIIGEDFDGDFIDDRAVFRPSNGTWYIPRSNDAGVTEVPLGAAGDIPVAADYDGDGKADVGTFTPSTGNWRIALSSTNYSTLDADLLIKTAWGGATDHPMPGDYDGDGEADMVYWRPSNGMWYRCLSSSSFVCDGTDAQQLGQNGDIPIRGDYDGDGLLDPTIWRPSTGNWISRLSSNLSLSVMNWGKSPDRPACMGAKDQQSLLSP